jgi:biotin synthase-related radical SAM superfamily protein
MNALTPVQGDPVVPRRKLHVSEYYRMAEAGILTRDDRVELIEGELIEIAPISPEHAATTSGAMSELNTACGRSCAGAGAIAGKVG